MQKIVIVANGAPYGSESLFNSLRLAIALREQESNLDLRRSDHLSHAVTAGLRGQKTWEGYNIQQMLEILTAQNVPVKLCKTCTDGRGISTLPLIDGVEIGTLVELAQWTLSADKVLTF
ncbi:DsrE/DsrF/TusD sulfur relay family protein [Escherichia coli]